MESAAIDVALSLLKSDGQYLAAIMVASTIVGIGTMSFIVRPLYPKPAGHEKRKDWSRIMPGVARLTGMAWCVFASIAYFHYLTPMKGLYFVQFLAAIPFAMFSGFLTPVVYNRIRRFTKKEAPPSDEGGSDTTEFKW